MSRSPTWLLDHQKTVYSQTGEDGIIEKILELLPGKDNWCVEFGAWDGISLTNTRNLLETKNYSGVLIEAAKDRFLNLQRNYAHRKDVYPINRFVGFSADDNLDQILSATPIPRDFDFLSIDIDGNDYHVWEAFSKYRPKALVIEYNPTIATHIRFVQPADPSVSQGSSLLSLVELGKKKGYELVCALQFNAFFVRKEFFPLFEIENNTPEVLRTDLGVMTDLFIGYDGTIFLRGSCKLPWHETPIRPERLQYLPKYLRRHAGDYSVLDKVLFAIWLIREDPKRLFREIRKRLGGKTP